MKILSCVGTLRRGTLIIAGALALQACVSTGGQTPGEVASLPLVVAHRGGTADAPENTLEAIARSVANGADAMWLSVQLSKDGVPVLYRPADLSALTNASGPVAAHTARELARINAGWSFRSVDGRYPYREHPAAIPTLRQALHSLPSGMPLMLDMKALPAEPLTKAVAQVLDEENAWSRTLIYSTDAQFQQAFAGVRGARVFESRDATRDRLAKVLLNEGCLGAPTMPVWSGFEMHRTVSVIEKFTLGEGTSNVNATLWTPATLACFRARSRVKILAISINNEDDYRAAACLGIDAVLVDSPAQFAKIRALWGQRAPSCLR
ncbi:glycerophosphodiester phosphodiesterase [Verminephrobacter aporrectodeae subsp. tuberculatae]|nr:glycerophosphodiester phosphodiesterase [Verminephrobacter aporrectodeae subsp. tuberculatae]